jgi:hypothetical protein
MHNQVHGHQKGLLMIINYATVVAVLLVGCSNRSEAPISSEGTVNDFLAVSPQDGQISVRLDAPVILAFAKPVDRTTVERGLRLISERSMVDSLCPVSQMMGHGTMMDSMSDSAKMRHLDQYHAKRGRFLWNSENTRCTFQPDSMMTPRTQYMIHLDREMTQMIEQRMGSNGNDGWTRNRDDERRDDVSFLHVGYDARWKRPQQPSLAVKQEENVEMKCMAVKDFCENLFTQ